MSFDVAVIGRGLWGTAAAMHLARDGAKTALIGPSEPADHRQFQGPFASHFDAGRITRAIDRRTFWARAATRSINRYAAQSQESGIEFYTPSGGMIASDDVDYMADVATVAAAEGITSEQITGAALAKSYPMYAFGPTTLAALDPLGGVVNPRAMRQAHETLAIAAGAETFEDTATALTATGVQLASGAEIDADQILLATGSYAGLSTYWPERPDMVVCARTVYFAELDTDEAARLAEMPSLIWQPASLDHYLYLLPPIRYPDGRVLLKIGGEDDSRTLHSELEALDWFHSPGNADVAQMLKSYLLDLMPDLAVMADSTAPCLLAHSPSGYPYIGRISDRVTIATACCGAGAKSADEIGRIAGQVAAGHSAATDNLGADVTPRFI